MYKYKTILKDAEYEENIEKSRFIAYVKPVETREEAEEFILSIKSKNKSATHNVPAFVIGEQSQLQWTSDDGEPQGTAGQPVLQMIVKEGLTNLAIVITRYFGGIKLGTGGLVRAYTQVAKNALEEAIVAEVRERSVVAYKIDYTYLGKLQNLSSEEDFEILSTIFEEKVTISISFEPEREEEIKGIISNVTSGTALTLSKDSMLVKLKFQHI